MKSIFLMLMSGWIGLMNVSAETAPSAVNRQCDRLISILYSGYMNRMNEELDVLSGRYNNIVPGDTLVWNDTLQLSDIIRTEFSVIPYLENPADIPYHRYVLMPVNEIQDWLKGHKQNITPEKMSLIVIFNIIHSQWSNLARLVSNYADIFIPGDDNYVISGMSIRRLPVDIIINIAQLHPQSEYLSKQLDVTERLMACADSTYIRNLVDHINDWDLHVSNSLDPLAEAEEWNDSLAVAQMFVEGISEYINKKYPENRRIEPGESSSKNVKEWVNDNLHQITPVRLKLLLAYFMIKTAWPYILEPINNTYNVSIFSRNNGLQYNRISDYLTEELLDEISKE